MQHEHQQELHEAELQCSAQPPGKVAVS